MALPDSEGRSPQPPIQLI